MWNEDSKGRPLVRQVKPQPTLVFREREVPDSKSNFWVYHYPMQTFPSPHLYRYIVKNGYGQVRAMANSLESAIKYGYDKTI